MHCIRLSLSRFIHAICTNSSARKVNVNSTSISLIYNSLFVSDSAQEGQYLIDPNSNVGFDIEIHLTTNTNASIPGAQKYTYITSAFGGTHPSEI